MMQQSHGLVWGVPVCRFCCRRRCDCAGCNSCAATVRVPTALFHSRSRDWAHNRDKWSSSGASSKAWKPVYWYLEAR